MPADQDISALIRSASTSFSDGFEHPDEASRAVEAEWDEVSMLRSRVPTASAMV